MNDDIRTTPRDSYTGTAGGIGTSPNGDTRPDMPARDQPNDRHGQSIHAPVTMAGGRNAAVNGESIYGRAWGWSGANQKHRH